MLDLWNHVSLAIFDALLGWTLYLPSDVMLFVLALFTSGIMVLTRPLATNQNLLRRLDDDRRRIKELIAQAKKDKDRPALLRYRTTGNQLAMRKLAAEGMPLLLAIVPVALLATWAMSRVEYHPPAENEEIEVIAYLQTIDARGGRGPNSAAVGDVIHLNPDPGLEVAGGWVTLVAEKPNEPTILDRFLVWTRLTQASTPAPDTLATWIIKGKASRKPYVLRISCRDETVERQLHIGQTTYAEAVVTKEHESITTQIVMRPVLLFGIVPGLGEILPGWLVGYIIIVVPLVFAVKWAFGIY